jgi:hypothetical protein
VGCSTTTTAQRITLGPNVCEARRTPVRYGRRQRPGRATAGARISQINSHSKSAENTLICTVHPLQHGAYHRPRRTEVGAQTSGRCCVESNCLLRRRQGTVPQRWRVPLCLQRFVWHRGLSDLRRRFQWSTQCSSMTDFPEAGQSSQIHPVDVCGLLPFFTASPLTRQPLALCISDMHNER